MADYSNTSPWYLTQATQDYLDIFRIRPVSAEDDDPIYAIEPQYTFRPDLLAFDIYGTAKLWWVFTQRNMDILRDPIFDFVAGVEIYLPKQESLRRSLGL
jgi:hypothetical protein